MAIKPPSTQVSSSLNLTPAKKKQGSGFVAFDKAAQQNVGASQQLGSQIQTGIGQQAQGVQGQLQGAVQGQQNQIGSEQTRLGQTSTVASQIQGTPDQVNKEQYKSLTSGTAKGADVGSVGTFAGALQGTAQQAQGINRDPNARLAAIKQFANQPIATQGMSAAQKGLDATLLGRNVDLQNFANQQARQAFGFDRQVGKETQALEASNKALTQQAKDAQATLRGVRTSAIGSEYDAAKKAADEYAATTGAFLKGLTTENVLAALGGEEGNVGFGKLKVEGQPTTLQKGGVPGDMAPTPDQAFKNKLLEQLASSGIDPQSIDITDIGVTGAADLIKRGITGRETITAEEALKDNQRARLKALYGLEDEGADRAYLNEAYKAPDLTANFSALQEAAARSAANTKAITDRYNQSIATLDPSIEAFVKNAAAADYSGMGSSTLAAKYSPEIAALVAQDMDNFRLRGQRGVDAAMLNQKTKDFLASDEFKQKYRQDILSQMESAAKTGNFMSGNLDDIGEQLYTRDRFGDNSGWARAMEEVRSTFAPYVQRKVRTLGGSISDPTLQGGLDKQLEGRRFSQGGLAALISQATSPLGSAALGIAPTLMLNKELINGVKK